MFKKNKQVIKALYIIFIIPLLATYLFPTLQMILLGNNRESYNRSTLVFSNWSIIVITIILIISSFLLYSKLFYEISYYILGIFIGFISKLFPINNNPSFVQISTIRYILIIGYAIIILIAFINLYRKNKV